MSAPTCGTRTDGAAPAPAGPVLVDHYEAQGWRVRQDARLDRVFEDRCDWVRTYGRAGQLAVDAGDTTLTYDELDARSNRLARHLRGHGVQGGERVALLLDAPVDSYVAVLAVLKIGATYVPLDPTGPADRLAAIVADARVRTVLTASAVPRVEQLTAFGADLVELDRVAAIVAGQDGHRLPDAERGTGESALAAIGYPADPRGAIAQAGVAVDHRSLANSVAVAAEVYGIRPFDRVYQGRRLAAPFAVEEIWVPWAVGATLVPRPAGADLRGPELHAFLTGRRVTAVYADPDLLATLDDLPDLRLLLVSGADLPAELITRWHRANRRLVGVYGPAGATVSAFLAELDPDRPVTLGRPLPTYSAVVLDPDTTAPARALPPGEVGEIGIAGIGLACGYLGRDDLTERAFIPDFLGIPANPSGRIHRTGDLGRATADGEVEHHGRVPGRDAAPDLVPVVTALVAPTAAPAAPVAPSADDPVAAAMAALLAEVLKVATVAADAHFFDDLGADSMVMARFCARLRKRDDLPSVSIKDVYANPSVARLAAASAPAAAPAPAAVDGPVAAGMAAVLAEVLKVATVAADAHFFDDLGADSMVMARFCARLRKRDDLPSLSIKDVYANPSIARLAAASSPAPAAVAAPAEPDELPMITTSLARAAGAVRGVRHRRVRRSRPRPVLCGALQLLAFVAYSTASAVAGFRGFAWVSAATDLQGTYLRAVVLTGASFLGLAAVPVLAKWLLVGRWTPRQVPVWTMTYLRFWIVKTLVQRNPMALFAGSPLYLVYLRALGVRIGRGAVILSRTAPVCTDLLTIGAGTVIRKDCSFTGYRAHDGLIQTAPVTLGRDVLVGEQSVLDIGTSMGDGAQLGHASALHAGQSVPAGQSWHGSPAVRTDVDHRAGIWQGSCSTLRRVVFGLAQLANLVLLLGPGLVVAAVVLFARFPVLGALVESTAPMTGATFYLQTVTGAAVIYFGGALAGLVVALTVPRLLHPVLRSGAVHRLYGVHYWVHRVITRLTNRRFWTELLGDTSFVVGYLRALGYRLTPVVQTGSNFGMLVKHDDPYLSAVGSGTVVADGLSMVNADYSSTSFRLAPVTIGRRNFLGNNIAYPARGRTGDDCLLATKVMVPIDGPVREGVGLLGSPSFEIPRSVERDTNLDVTDPQELRRLLRAKARHNTVTMVLRLLTRGTLFAGLVTLSSVAYHLQETVGLLALVPLGLASMLFTFTFAVLVERATNRLRLVAPRGCSIYERGFWRHERAWKLPTEPYFRLLDGTPFKALLWRLLGVRIGRRVFDDGCSMTERTFVAIGDGATLNAGTIIQCHSQEDGAFKSDRTAIGAGVTLGVNAFVHYGVVMGDGAVLAADSFLMKGEEVPAQALWGGNPARRMRRHAADLRVRRIDRRDGAVLVAAE